MKTYIKRKMFEILFNQYLRWAFVSICIAYAFDSACINAKYPSVKVSTLIDWKWTRCHFMRSLSAFASVWLSGRSCCCYTCAKQLLKISPITLCAMCADMMNVDQLFNRSIFCKQRAAIHRKTKTIDWTPAPARKFNFIAENENVKIAVASIY